MAGSAAFAAAMALLAASAQRPKTASPLPPVRGLQSATALQITMSAPLFPSFDPSISDYAFRYQPGTSALVSVKAPRDTQVSVDGQAFRRGFRDVTFTTKVNVTPGQSFSLVVDSPAGSKTYHVRCLPTDFPAWTTERPGTPQVEYYIFAPNINVSGKPNRIYAIISDNYGVPLWWYRDNLIPTDVKLLPNGNVGWTNSVTGVEERRLDGSLAHSFAAASQLGGKTDNHEFLLLPNGDYVFIAAVSRGPVDLTPYGGPATATVIDNVIEEVTPDGTLVWHWSAMDHLPVSETDSVWRSVLAGTGADPYHMNSVEPNGDGFVISLRHCDAVFRIDKASGNIVWKLGGLSRPESLKFVGDTYGNFGGEHDARILPDGTLTVHDNGSRRGRAPRAVRFRLDLAAKTATLVEQLTDADAPSSSFIGSARKQAAGDWVTCWGGNPYVTELTADGNRVFRITFADQYLAYRGTPVPFGLLSRSALRSGMDAQFPR